MYNLLYNLSREIYNFIEKIYVEIYIGLWYNRAMKNTIIATSYFEKAIKKLAKKFPCVKQVYREALESLESSPGFGDEIEGHQDFYKVRYPNKDANRGKKGGFRLIYHWENESNKVVLVMIYSKTEYQEVDWNAVSRSVEELEGNENA